MPAVVLNGQGRVPAGMVAPADGKITLRAEAACPMCLTPVKRRPGPGEDSGAGWAIPASTATGSPDGA